MVLQNHGLLTTGGTVDEAAYLFTLMERSCEVQIMVESTGIAQNLIGDKEAEFTAKVNADPVSSLPTYDMIWDEMSSNKMVAWRAWRQYN